MKTLLLDCCPNATQAVCESTVWIVAIIAIALLLWKLMDHYANCCADTRKRAWELEDIARKQNSDLLSKKLEMLKEQCYEQKKNSENTPTQEKVNEYIAAIDAAIKK